MMEFEKEEHQLKEENIRLQRKLFLEMERREALSRQLSESESSLEMDEERFVYGFKYWKDILAILQKSLEWAAFVICSSNSGNF